MRKILTAVHEAVFCSLPFASILHNHETLTLCARRAMACTGTSHINNFKHATLAQLYPITKYHLLHVCCFNLDVWTLFLEQQSLQ